jgi:hypothetical protein
MLGTLVGTIIGPFASVYSENVTTPGPRSTLVMYVNTICSYVQLSKTAHFHVVWIIGPKKGEPRILVSYLIQIPRGFDRGQAERGKALPDRSQPIRAAPVRISI